MALHTVNFVYTPGQTLYAFPIGMDVLSNYVANKVDVTEESSPDTGQYFFVANDSDGYDWCVFSGASQPASWNAAIDLGGIGKVIDLRPRVLLNHAVDNTGVLLSTVVSGVTSQTTFTLAAGPTINAFGTECYAVFRDVSGGSAPVVASIVSYTGSTKTLVIAEALPFTVAALDTVHIFASNPRVFRSGRTFRWTNHDTDETGGGTDDISIADVT